MFSSQGARYLLENPLPEGAYDPLDNGEAMEINVPPLGNRRRQRGGGDDDDGDDVGGGGAGAGAAQEPEWHPVPCDDVEEIRTELKPAGRRHNCFACRYVGQERGNKIPDHRLASVLQTMADGIGEAWPPALAVTVAKQYEAWRVIINSSASGDREPLPVWNAASILDHWRLHTCDPQINQWMHLMYLQYSIDKIRGSSLERRDAISGATKHDKDQFQIMVTAMRMWYTVSAKEPRKLSFFNDGSMMNTKVMSNGGMSRSARPVYAFHVQKNKRYRVAGSDMQD